MWIDITCILVINCSIFCHLIKYPFWFFPIYTLSLIWKKGQSDWLAFHRDSLEDTNVSDVKGIPNFPTTWQCSMCLSKPWHRDQAFIPHGNFWILMTNSVIAAKEMKGISNNGATKLTEQA